MTRVRQIALILVKSTCVAVVLLLGMILVWELEPPPSGTYERTLLTTEVEPGGTFKLRINVVWTKTCWSVLHRQIVDGAGKITRYESEPRLNHEGRRTFVIQSQVPLDAVPGDAEWIVRTDWYCNPWQWQKPKSVELEPIKFKILPPRGASYQLPAPLLEPCTKMTCLVRRAQ